jgi:hypothetical protein
MVDGWDGWCGGGDERGVLPSEELKQSKEQVLRKWERSFMLM